MLLGFAALATAAACGIAPEHTVPEFTAGNGGESGALESGDTSDGGSADTAGIGEGPVDSADPSDSVDDGADDGGADIGGGVDGGPLDDDAGDDSGTTTGESADPLPFEPLYRIAVRVHAGGSSLSDAQLGDILAEMNTIWRSQAAVCFEFEVVNDDTTMADGFDMWFQPEVGGPNGYYSGDHDIYVRDQPNLNSAPNPAMIAAARTAAHELGHGLTLAHDQNSDDYLMRSGTFGWEIPMYQLNEARERAAQKALADTTPLVCSPPTF